MRKVELRWNNKADGRTASWAAIISGDFHHREVTVIALACLALPASHNITDARCRIACGGRDGVGTCRCPSALAPVAIVARAGEEPRPPQRFPMKRTE